MIPLMKNAFINELQTRTALVEFVQKADKFSMGQQCAQFENEFARFQGAGEAVLFNSGGSANLAIFQSLKNIGLLQNGDKVGFSALTWSTNLMPIIQMGFEPVPVDCNPRTLNIMSCNLEKTLGETELKALFITNALGFAGDLHEIKRICDARGILLIEDNCEALGTELHGTKTGSFGFASSFSFFVAHHMSTIEGGMVCTDNEEFAEMLRIVRANGWDRNLTAVQQHKWRRKFHITSEFQAKYTFYDLGFNLRPTEITGFLGCYQLQFLEENIKKRQSTYMTLESVTKNNPDLITLDRSHLFMLSSFAFPVLCQTNQLRDTYAAQFSGAGVEIRPMIAGNIQKQPFYRKYVTKQHDLAGADMIHSCGFYCGDYPELTPAEIEILCSCLSRY